MREYARVRALVITQCCNCGKDVRTDEVELSQGRGKYCSKKCHNAAISYREEILAAMPGTMYQLAKRARCSIEAVYKGLKAMAAAGKCHVSGLTPAEQSEGPTVGPWALVYAVGRGKDKDAPASPRDALTHQYKKLLLAAMPCGQCDMQKKTRLSKNSISRLLKQLHAARACHIERWRKPKQGPAVAIYRRGDKPDAPCDVTYETRDERNKKSMARRKAADPERTLRLQREARTRWRRRKFGDPIVNALFGKPEERKQKTTQTHGGNNE